MTSEYVVGYNRLFKFKELKAAFDDEATSTGQPRLLLTAAVGAGKSTVDSAYEVQQISE